MFGGQIPKVAPCRNCSASAIDIRLMVRGCVRGVETREQGEEAGAKGEKVSGKEGRQGRGGG
mgnify:CR=1 FL=1